MTIHGFIYRIDSPSLRLSYIGSTEDMKARTSAHKCERANVCTSRTIIRAGDATFTVIAEGEFEDAKAMRAQEGRLIRYWAGQYALVNKRQEGRDKATYRADNLATIKQQANTHFVCACGGKYTRTNLSHHVKSKRHTDHAEGVEVPEPEVAEGEPADMPAEGADAVAVAEPVAVAEHMPEPVAVA